MRIILDGMGGDNAPFEMVKGAVEAAKELRSQDQIIIVGIENQINEALGQYKGQYSMEQIKVVHASEVITTDEAPVRAVRRKKDSSMVKGLNMIKDGEGDIFVSAGSTGALMAGGIFILGRIQGIDRPALAVVYPILNGKPALLVDAGANTECKPSNLLEFATMGSIYMEKVIGRTNPRIGLVNNGAEETKGSTLTKATYELLDKSKLNFIGNIEAREIAAGPCDVIVCDGFVGNVILKLTEGLAMSIFSLVKKKFTEGPLAKMGAALLAGKMKDLKKEFDYSEYGGSPILGIKGPVIKMHGSSDAKCVKNTIIKGIPYVQGNVVQIIQNSVEELEEITISE